MNSWLQECDRHRAAVLDGINGCPKDVSLIRAAVIAGRSRQCDLEYIDRLRSTLGDRVDFQTFDELLLTTAETIKHVHLVG